MNRNRPLAGLPLAALVAASIFVTGSANAEEGAEQLKLGNWNLAFRYRLELVDQDPLGRDATASTLRGRLNYKTADHEGFSAFVELDYVAEVFEDRYNAGGGNTPDRTQYPVVADPDGEDLNQAFLQYKRGKSQFRAGRQRIIFDNARFVGNVGWRQNPQTYDALSWAYQAGEHGNFTYAYVGNVNRIFGDDVPAGDHEHSTHLLNYSRSFEGAGKFSLYWYDIDNEDAPGLSNRTLGARFSGSARSGDTQLGYTFEYASQDDAGDNPVPYSADYYRADFSVGNGGTTYYAGFESLSGNSMLPGQAFRTPLATLHAFNGWADKFLGTPAAGLEDAFAGVKGKTGAWSWNVLYHKFTAESGPADFGSEIDASLSRGFGGKYGLLFKLADFNSDSPAYGDTYKLWVQFTANIR